ncbi:hypothetical protein HYV85_04120 [Candidatus Woesearchaeota archaeon]|nr:hypothetical protein [Candidatus Woesearchaeota archaeon]
MRKEVTISYSAMALVSLAVIVLSFSLLMAAVLAQEEEGLEEEVLVEEEIVPEESAGVTPDSPLYVFDKIVDNVQLALAKGDDKTKKALEIKEERIAEAAVMVEKKKPDAAVSALELAKKATEQAQKDLSPDLEKETNENVRRAARLLSGLEEKLSDKEWEKAKKAFDEQLSEEEKVRVALLVSKSRLAYCDSIAKEDYDLMKGDELCQIEKAPEWLRGKVEGEFMAREENARKQILDSVSTCIVDPKKCDCSRIPVAKHSQDCEVKKALAIRCEYENDNGACAELSKETPDEFLPEFLGEEGKGTILELLRKKEQQMFDRFKPPECEAAATFEDCFKIMKDLYGEPPECEGLSDDECAELMKSRPPPSEEELMNQFPPECREAGVKTPIECAELMFSKYGKPPQCEGLDTRECMKLMRHERPDAMQNAMPPECQEAGATQPRQCFDIMTAKYGFPPECEGLSTDDCFKEMMKRGPGQGPQTGIEGQEPPECTEKGARGKDCFLLMMELHGTPQECEGLSTDECFQNMVKEGPKGGGGHCIGLSPEECRSKLQEFNELPPECAQNPDQCQRAFEGRGVPGGIPAECAGLKPEQCNLVMMQKFGPPECKDVSTKDECEAIMKEKYGTEGGGFGGGPGPGGVPGPGGQGGFRNECEGLAREECDKKMFEKFAPPECSGLTREECGRTMRDRFEQQGQQGGGFGGGPGPGGEGTGVPPECQGLSEEDCRQRFFEGKGQGEIRGEGEHREIPPGFDRREGPGPRQTLREPLGEPVRGQPSECQGLSASECSSVMEEKFRAQYPQQPSQQPMQQQQQMPQAGQAGQIEQIRQGFPQEQYPTSQYPREQQPSSSGSYPSDSGSGGSYPSPSSGSEGSGSESGGDSGSSAPAPSGEQSTAAAITGQIIRIVKWVGGR